MPILAWCIAVLALLYWWSRGSWFPRIVMAVLLWPVGIVILSQANPNGSGFSVIAATLIIPAIISYFLAGIPMFIRRGYLVNPALFEPKTKPTPLHLDIIQDEPFYHG